MLFLYFSKAHLARMDSALLESSALICLVIGVAHRAGAQPYYGSGFASGGLRKSEGKQ